MKKYTINQLAKLAGITVRTLHYYDQIDLLNPSYIGENGYRYYLDAELVKLQQILFFKELEFSLDSIKEIMNKPRFNKLQALEDQEKLLIMKHTRLENILNTIHISIDYTKGGEHTMNTDDLYGSFTKKEMEQYIEEAKLKWGDTTAYKQSEERTKNWTKDDYVKIQQTQDTIIMTIVNNMDKGLNDEEIQKEIHKMFIWLQQFYDCSYVMFRNLGQMYIQDERFKAFYDKYHIGLAQFISNAISYYCDLHEGAEKR